MTPESRDFRARLRANIAPASADAPTPFASPPPERCEVGAGASLSDTWISTPEEEREIRRIDRRIRWERNVATFCVVAVGLGVVAVVVQLLGGK